MIRPAGGPDRPWHTPEPAGAAGRMGRDVRRAAEPLVWWAVLFVTYLFLISSVSVTELIVDAAAAGAGAAAAVAARRALLTADNPESYRPHARWASWALPLPAQIPLDTLMLARPRLESTLTELSLTPGDEAGGTAPDNRAAARRGFATLVISSSPGTYVLRVDPDRDVLVLHRVGRKPSALERRNYT